LLFYSILACLGSTHLSEKIKGRKRNRLKKESIVCKFFTKGNHKRERMANISGCTPYPLYPPSPPLAREKTILTWYTEKKTTKREGRLSCRLSGDSMGRGVGAK
jgi:hypothetical protein